MCPKYQNINYPGVIDMLDNVSPGLSARHASEVSDSKCGFMQSNHEANARFSFRTYEVAGLEQPIHEELGQMFLISLSFRTFSLLMVIPSYRLHLA